MIRAAVNRMQVPFWRFMNRSSAIRPSPLKPKHLQRETDMAERIRQSHAWFVFEDGDEVLGYAYAAPLHSRAAYGWSVEASIYVAAGGRGRGVGQALLGHLLAELRERGFVNVFAGIALPNVASVGLFESFGFERVGVQKKVGFKLNAWHDVGLWQLQLREPTIPPPALSRCSDGAFHP